MICIGLCTFIPFLKNIINQTNLKNYDRIFNSNSSSHQSINHPINQQCYICLQNLKNQVVATCNHSYCAQCILDYINKKPESPISCPACRQQVLCLFRKFQLNSDFKNKLKNDICKYNAQHAKQPGFIRSIMQIGNIIKNLSILLSSQGIAHLVNSPRIKMIILMILYMVSPVDLLPEGLLGPIGLIDDGAVLLTFFKALSGLMIQFMRAQGQRNRVNQ